MLCTNDKRESHSRLSFVKPKFYLFSSALLTIFCFSGIAEADTNIELSAAIKNFNYKEFSEDNTLLDQETGLLPGVAIAYNKNSKYLGIKASFSRFFGKVDYNGQTQAGVPVTTKTEQEIDQFGVMLLSARLPQFNNLRLFGAYLFNHWDRNVLSNGFTSGLSEIYSWHDVILGINLPLYHSSKINWQLETSGGSTLNPMLTIDLTGLGYATPDLALEKRFLWNAAIKFNYLWTSQITAQMSYLYTYYQFGASEPKILTNRFNSISIKEPRSTSNHQHFLFTTIYHFQ